MSNVPVFIVVNLVITDSEEYRIYEKGFFTLLKKYRGTFVTYDDNPINLEGNSPREGRIIIFSFPKIKWTLLHRTCSCIFVFCKRYL